MKRRVLAVLMTVLLVFQTIPASVFADTENAAATNQIQIGNHYVADQNNKGSLSEKKDWKDGTAVTDEKDWRVRVNKTIAATETENEFDITLTVDTKDRIETEISSPDAAVVFAVDLSSSMLFCLEHGKNDNCDNVRMDAALEALQTFINKYADSGTSGKRMIAITGFYKDASVITDWVNASTLTAPEGEINSKLAKLADGLSSHSGTNIEGGLLLARNLLTSSKIEDIDFRTAILLSDGGANSCVVSTDEASKYKENYGSIPPMRYNQADTTATAYTGYYSNADYHFHHGGAVDAIKQIKAGYGTGSTPQPASFESVYCGTATEVLTVHDPATNDNKAGGCKQTGVNCKYCNAANAYWDSNQKKPDITVPEFLRDNSDAFVESYDIEALVHAFEDIQNRIEIATQAWKVTDPMGQHGVLVTEFAADSNVSYNDYTKTLTWNLLETEPKTVKENGEDFHRYSVTYKYKLNTFPDGVVAGNYFATNKATELKYYFQPESGEASELNSIWFNVPSVQGFKADFDFVKNGRTEDGELEPLPGAKFKVTHASNCGCGFSHNGWEATSDRDGKVEFNNIPSGHKFVLRETGVPGGYIGADDRSFSVEYGEVVMDEPIGSDGIVNEKLFVDIPVEKIWQDTDNQDGLRPASITVNLIANGSVVNSVVLDESNSWKSEFKNMPRLDSKNNTIVYSVEEVTVPSGYTSSVFGNVNDGFRIVNKHTPETVDFDGKKVWVDSNDQDGIRPGEITVQLYVAEGENAPAVPVEGKIKKLSASGNEWRFGIIGSLPKYKRVGDKSVELIYSIKEVNVPDGYTVSYPDNNTIVNTHTPETVDVPVTKTWTDAENQDGKRPGSITVNLLADGVKVDDKVITGTGETWEDKFTGLPKYKKVDGERVEISYSVEEINVPDGYTVSYPDNNTIVNTHILETVDIPVKKIWTDAENQDGKRPGSITVNLLADGVKVDDTVITGTGDTWEDKFTGLPKYKEGKVKQEIRYTVEEVSVTGYTPEITGTAASGFVVTNTHEPEKTSLTVKKVWDDNSDQDGKRPGSIEVELYANGELVKTEPVTGTDDEWTYTFTDLDKYSGGKEIVYTVKEASVAAGYEPEVEGYTITNKYTPETIDIPVTKTWTDNSNADSTRPEKITVNLFANGEKVDSATMTEADGWKHTFTGLPKNAGGVPVVYKVTEEKVDNYLPQVSLVSESVEDGIVINNKLEPGKTSVSVVKDWEDGEDQDGIRPGAVEAKLLANGKETGIVVKLDKNNGWTETVSDLTKYDGNGELIQYTFEESEVDGYTPELHGNMKDGFVIVNTHKPATVGFAVSKKWEDNSDQDDVRPESVTVRLYADGIELTDKTVVLSEENKWTHVWADLAAKSAGKDIVYTISEDEVAGYTPDISGTAASGFVVTNTHEPEKTSLTVKKVWDDNSDQDGKRPGSIEVELYANGEFVKTGTVTGTDDVWTHTFTDLDKYSDGKEIEYTVKEASVATGYEPTVDGYTITNKHTPETIDIPVTKKWTDNNNINSTRPESIKVNLLADGHVVKTADVKGEGNEWNYTFENLPKYKAGAEIKYSIREEQVYGYTPSVNGYNINNILEPGETSVSVTKVWDDSDDQDGLRPASVAVTLLKNGQKTGKIVELSAENGWTETVSGLDKYDENSRLIQYSFEEFKVDGYTPSYNGNMKDGFQIVNSHTPETIGIEGSKKWKDADDQDGLRPESITVRLLADGEEFDAVNVTAENEWTWSFENLPKYRDHGQEIVYTITEDAVENYSPEIKGFDVKNIHTPGETSVTVTKSWNDKDDQDGIRPESVTVNLLADGKVAKDKTVTLSEENDWTYTWTELPVNAAGEEIAYTVQEKNVPDGYKAVVSGDAVTGYVITNCHEPAVVDFNGSKTWVDNDDEKGLRPESITVNLLADGEAVAEATVTAENGWAWSFENQPEFNAGNKIEYTVTEDAVAEYNAFIDGMDIINTLKAPAAVIPMAVKTLEGAALTEGMFGFELVDEEGNLIDTAQNAADGSITFGELEFDAAGTYTYFISEVIPEDALEFEEGEFYKDGIVYDSAVYLYKVTVGTGDDQNYEVTDTEIMVQNGSNFVPVAGDIEFTNVFDEGFDGGGDDSDTNEEEPGDDDPGNGDDPSKEDDDTDEDYDGTEDEEVTPYVEFDEETGDTDKESDKDADRDDASQTGDDFNMALYGMMALAALAVAAGAFRRKRTE